MNGAGKVKQGTGSGGKGRGRPRKLSYLTMTSRKLARALSSGERVVVRRNNGLLYYGEVLRVEETNDRCQIKFEEGVSLYTLFKDVHRAPGHGEACCGVCNGESSDRSNPIVVCDSCCIGYHQCCHNPPIPTSVIQTLAKFFCKLCTFAASVKHDGCPKFNNSVAANEDLRHVLPYKTNLLTWDAQHRTNVEQCYCYCGGPGDWHCKMLQCCRCRQWFHEACLQCLQHPLLYGDCFFMFVCSHCNQGQEYIKRLPFRWMDVAQLALFNLTLSYTHKYYDLDDILMPWITRHEGNLGIDNLLEGKSVKSQEVRNKVETALTGHRTKFMSGREVKKRHTLWGLILRVPPNPPSVVVPLSGPINSHVLSNPSVKGRKTKHILPTQCQSPVPLKYLSRCSLDPSQSIMFRNVVSSKLFPEANNNNVTNGYTNNHCYTQQHNGLHRSTAARSNGHLHTSSSESGEEDDEDDKDSKPVPAPSHRGPKKLAARSLHHAASKSSPAAAATTAAVAATASIVCKMEPQTSPAQRDLSTLSPQRSSSRRPSSLEQLIRRPPNYHGMNHPFRTEIEKQTERQQLRHFQARMAYLKKEYAGELETFRLAQRDAQTNPPPSSLRERSPAVAHSKSPSASNFPASHNKSPASATSRFPASAPSLKSSDSHAAAEGKGRRGAKRKLAVVLEVEEGEEEEGGESSSQQSGECVRRSKRSRMNAERYQHLLDSFPRRLPKPEPSEEGAVQRWKWRSVVDQLRYGEKFQVRAWRRSGRGGDGGDGGGRPVVDFLLHWDEEED